MPLAQFIKTAGEPTILKRSLKVSFIVGTILMFINHGDKLLSSNIDATLIIKILMTYCVPFCVSTQASVSATLQSRKKVV
ncbi:nitrate/nitrite transporter NrtS [Vibrio splendidus]|uniref:Phosphoenolpyruvate protein kinase n=1 Tax=Vibrio splendidus TaxID=29497 RepID=A0A2G4B286_VIBSP|nr:MULTISPECIES: nitrate/nitrite transporter NrtS [Vibrio]MBT9242517.1 nitrate/nitrite transporter NrtS [Vibrio splendidus]MCT4351244.1 nitrate/nitrite transporter NrtS [Vibrio sp. NC2]MDH5903073.1 nitrate/nitrite transporter NrtS [Vibrio splendidus]MDH5912697.1 nitrate/nitrite transporter NrtS [Vibrio splendidus]MDH5940184.1 nitrate/nitrite transporter NrtS [Vibrio splendidus]